MTKTYKIEKLGHTFRNPTYVEKDGVFNVDWKEKIPTDPEQYSDWSCDRDDVINFIEQIISERDKELKEENNYQCVDCGNWNVKSPLTQCSECRRQD